MIKMTHFTEYKNLEKHFASIMNNENLKDLTTEQIKAVAAEMEVAYQKGKYESNEGKNSIRNCTVNVKVDCNIDDIKGKVNKALSDVFEDLSKTISTEVSF